jgi:hypothetical protein
MDMTNINSSSFLTDKSDKTYAISNEEFLKAIFGKATEEHKPMLVSFTGNPSKVKSSCWAGKPWDWSQCNLSGNANNYFSLATFNKNTDGKYHRKKSQFQALHAIMLDDFGTKVSKDRLTFAPSWIIETSENNFQVGYILAEPITDIKQADQLMNAIVAAGLCDPGANGPTARLARLPVAVNGKSTPEFQCQLQLWNPENCYSTQELIDGLQIEIIEPTNKRNLQDKIINITEDCERVFCPSPEENMVIAELKNRTLYKSSIDSKRHDITCPWVSEHTDSVDSGTVYFEPDENYPVGGFKCQHGHCSHRYISDLLNFLTIDNKTARMKPTIRIVKGEIHRIVNAAEKVLADTGKYYQCGGMIVFINRNHKTNELLIERASQQALVSDLSKFATWEQFDKRLKLMARIDPPERHISIIYNSNDYKHLSQLNGIARQPYFRPDNSLVKSAGYDESTHIYGHFDSDKFSIPDNPTREDAQNALEVLRGILSEFCFASPEDEMTAIAALLTATLRPSLDLAPMFHVRAHAVGSGKSYLCSVISVFATAQKGTPHTFPTDNEECQKLLFAELQGSPAVIEFDNLTSDILPHKTLCTALTSEYFNGRILGVSKTATVSTRTLFLSSGNNVGPIYDMARRCITINLEPNVEIPAARSFNNPNLIATIMKDREKFISAAITIVNAYISSGCPKTECKDLSGFCRWSELCRQPLLWLGGADPAASIYEAIKKNPDRELLGRLLIVWNKIFGNKPTKVKEAVDHICTQYSYNEDNDLKEILHEIADERGEINNRRLGRWIKRHQGQIVDGFKFESCSGTTSAERWQVKSV